jgi:hypothetical protein
VGLRRGVEQGYEPRPVRSLLINDNLRAAPRELSKLAGAAHSPHERLSRNDAMALALLVASSRQARST